MPIYEYQCNACDHAFEEFQFMSEDALTKCPGCGKKKLRRLPGTGAALIFKGSGFYETDYRSDTYKEAAKADAAPAAKADGNGKTGTTPAADTGKGGAAAKAAADSPKSPARGADD